MSRHGSALTSVTSAPGCPACRDTGFATRIGIFEMLPISRRLRAMLERQEPETALRAHARAEGVRSMPAAALVAINSGLTTVDEVLRVVPAEDSSSEELAREDAETATVAALQEAAVSAAAGPFRVLVVDDDALIQKVIVRTLQTSPLPIETVTAADAAEATRLLDEQPIHLALLDVELPDLSGFELCGRIRAHARVSGVPIFMLTGRGDVDAKAEAFRAGADDYLVKPVVPEELVLRVVRALERNYGAKVTGSQVVGATLAARPEPLPEPEELADPELIEATVEPLAAAPLVTTLQELPPEQVAPIRPSTQPFAPAPATKPEPRPEAALFKTKPEASPSTPEADATAALPRQDAWSRFLGRSRPQ